MRDNFETLVQQLLEGDFSANQTFVKLFSDSLNHYARKLTDDEIQYLQNETEKKEVSAVIYYVQGCLCQIKKEYFQAIALYDQAIALGNAAAMHNRAFMHQHGQGGDINYPQAIALYDQAIALGNAAAMNNRAFMHQHGQGGDINYPQAIALYDQAIALGNAAAMHNRAFMHQHGQGGDINYPQAIALYDQAIALGNAAAMNNRAFMHQHGQGGDINYPQAIALYDQAIALGNAAAMHNRAFMHQQGRGGDINYPEAAKLYRNAALLNPSESAHRDALSNTKQSIKKSSPDYDAVAYQFAAAHKTLPHCLKTHPQRIALFAEDTLLTLDEKNAIMATFKPSFILKSLTHFPESLLRTAEKTFIASLGNTHPSLDDFIHACQKSECFNAESKGNILFLTLTLDHVMKHFKPQIAKDNRLSWFVTALLSRLGQENIENDHFKSLTKLRGICANPDDGRLFAISLAYAECHYSVCQASSIHALNHQKRDTFSTSATTGQQVDAWRKSEDNREKIKMPDESLDFFNPPNTDLTMAWLDTTEFKRLLEPTKNIRNSMITTRDSIMVGMRNSLFVYKPPAPVTENTANNDLDSNEYNNALL